MKNSSTVAARLVTAAFFSALAAGAAHAQAQLNQCAFLPDAPQQHLVVKHDTLWDISGKFLEHPWCWGQVWGMNRAQIRDPHWIYPGQIVYLDRAAGRLRLGWPGGDAGMRDADTLRLSPQVRVQGMDRDAVPSIPAGVIEPFLAQPLIIESGQLSAAPRIIAAQENHVFLGKNDKAYVRGDLKENTSFQVFRPGSPLKDPVSGEVLGHEAFYLGTVKLQALARANADVHTFIVTSSVQEMGAGDQLVPTPTMPMRNYAPHPPQGPVDARVMAIYGGLTHAGQNQVVSINRGTLDGLDDGAVLQLYRAGKTVAVRGFDEARLPDELVGSLFIFRVFRHISYALIMQVTQPVEVGDIALSPQ
jgi:hypothetical protein